MENFYVIVLWILRPPRSTRTYTRFPSTTHFRSLWPQFFSTQPALIDYFQAFAAEQGLRDCIRFGTEVLESSWIEADQQWAVTTRGPDGTETTERFEAVVSATGQLNRPKYPDIPGVGSFERSEEHTSEPQSPIRIPYAVF